jgi:hypothetical protein
MAQRSSVNRPIGPGLTGLHWVYMLPWGCTYVLVPPDRHRTVGHGLALHFPFGPLQSIMAVPKLGDA